MDVAISIGDPSRSQEEELRSLYQWFLADATIRRHGKPQLSASKPLEPGQQGPLIDILSLVIGSGLNSASLAVAIATWRSTRPLRPNVTIMRADGSSVTITGSSPEETARLVQLLNEPAIDPTQAE